MLRLRPGVRRAALLAFVAIVVALAVSLGTPDEGEVTRTLDQLRAFGWAGAFAVAALYVPGSVLCLPGTPITLVCAVTFGFLPTFVAVVVCSNLGALAAFVAGRTLVREDVARWVARHPRLAALERAFGGESLKLALLLRLSPLVPFNGLNYALSAMRIRTRTYVLATFAGMLPGTLVNCWTGSALGELADALAGRVEPNPATWTVVALGLVATIVAVVYGTRLARAELERTLDDTAT